MNPTNISIKTLTFGVAIAMATLPAWSAEEKATKKKSAKSAVTSLQAGTLSADISTGTSQVISPLNTTTGPLPSIKPGGANTPNSNKTDVGTNGSSKPVGAQSGG